MTETMTEPLTDVLPEMLVAGEAEPTPPLEVEPEQTEPEVASPAPRRTRPNITLVWTDELWQGQGHPHGMRAGALVRGYRLLDAVGALRWREVKVVQPEPSLGSRDGLATFHSDAYLQTVAALNDGTTSLLTANAFGFNDAANPPFPNMAAAAARYVAAARTAVQEVLSGATTAAFSLAGRQQHARAAQAQGDHIFNDVLLALQDAATAGQKVAFISLEAERPLVIEEAFAENPSVLVTSLHEDSFFVYPGAEAATPLLNKRAIAVPLPPGAGDDEVVAAFEQVVMPVLAAFEPELTMVLVGGSAHFSDALGHLRLTTRGYAQIVDSVNQLSPRLVVLGGDGSDMGALARVWTVVLATLVERRAALPRQLPAAYARNWGEGLLEDGPLRAFSMEMREYVSDGVERAIAQTQRLVFPQWKLPVPTAPMEEGWNGLPDLEEERPLQARREEPREVKLQRKSADQVLAELREKPASQPQPRAIPLAQESAEAQPGESDGQRRRSRRRAAPRSGPRPAAGQPQSENPRKPDAPAQPPTEGRPERRSSRPRGDRRHRGGRRGGGGGSGGGGNAG